VGIAGDNVALLEREFGDTRERFGARESTVTDLQQVRSRLELARAQLLTAQATAASSDARFLRVVGAPAGDLRQPPPLTIPARTLEDAYAQADAGNPVLAAAYSRERISRAAVEAARAERFPRVGVEGRASTGSSRALGAELRQTDLRGALTITGTLDAGIVRARLGQASEANDADWRLIDAALRDSRAELAEAWNESQAQAAGIERLAEAVEASRQAMEGALLQERAGLRTTLDVLELARDLLQVRTSYNATTAASFVARARVLAAMGSLDLEFLLPEAAGYRPQEHLRTVEGSADLPLVTPVVRALDSLLTPPRRDRAVRDPAAPLAVRAARAAQDQAGP
ncbi:MAG: TolC family protein, partial [Hyphomicrobiaceae bacterium]